MKRVAVALPASCGPSTRDRRRARVRAALLATLLGFVAGGLLPAQAQAAFPGPNGKIAFLRNTPGSKYDVYTMNSDGSGPTFLTTSRSSAGDPALAGDPAFSPDGTKIAFVTNRDGNLELYVMNVDGSGQTRLTNDPLTDDDPTFSPDGKKIAFTRNSELYVMNADGSGQVRLTDNLANDGNPVFSPDGQKIAFDSDRDGNFEIYVMNANGTDPKNLTNNDAAYDQQPTFSPDGNRIAFSRGFAAAVFSGNFSIYAMNADGSDQTALTSGPGDLEPAFSPDGRKIAFATGYPPFRIIVSNVDGSQQTALTQGVTAADAFPDWGPLPAKAPGAGPGPAQGGDPGPGQRDRGRGGPRVVGGCLNFESGIGGRRLGPARLGRSRSAHRRLFRGARVRLASGMERYCIRGGGFLRIGYPTARLNRTLSRGLRRRIRDRAVILYTSNPRYSLSGVNPGSSITIMRRNIRGERRVRIAGNVWYVAPGTTSQLVFKTRGGKVREIGLIDKRLTRSPRATRQLLGAWRRR